jgi:hypothetical protein
MNQIHLVFIITGVKLKFLAKVKIKQYKSIPGANFESSDFSMRTFVLTVMIYIYFVEF